MLKIVMSGIGEVVTLNMLNGESVQGRVKAVNAEMRTILLERPFLNGKPMGVVEKAFPINAIAAFKILDVKSKRREQSAAQSVVPAEKTSPKLKELKHETSPAKQTKPESSRVSVSPQKTAKGKNVAESASPQRTAKSGSVPGENAPQRTAKLSGSVPGESASQRNAKQGSVPPVGIKTESVQTTTSVDNNPSGGSPAATTAVVASGDKQPSWGRMKHHQPSPSSSPHPSRSTSSSPTQLNSKLGRGPPNRDLQGKRFYAYGSELKSPRTPGPPGRRWKNRGQCGIPELDDLEKMHINKNNEELTKPIDFDLNEDFDFEKNLEIFRNYEEAGDAADSMTAAKARFSHVNFPHYANIISDPLRVTSWTTKVHDTFTASRIEKTLDGQRIPFMRFSEKEKFLRKAEPYLGSDMFHVLVADRLLMFIWSVIDRFGIMVGQVVVIDSAAVNTFLTTMFLRHISNRACKTVVYSCLLGQYNLPHVDQVHEVGNLPKVNVQLVVAVGPVLLRCVRDWIKQLPSGTHLICIEQPLDVIKNEHILMIGVGTDPDDDEKRQKSPGCLRGVVDIGIPFAWMDAESAACLSRTFATQTIALC